MPRSHSQDGEPYEVNRYKEGERFDITDFIYHEGGRLPDDWDDPHNAIQVIIIGHDKAGHEAYLPTVSYAGRRGLELALEEADFIEDGGGDTDSQDNTGFVGTSTLIRVFRNL